MDVIDSQVQLRAKTTSAAKPKQGIDVINAKVDDLTANDIYEPLAVKEQIINAATEVASTILRIDAASKAKTPAAGAGAGGGGMSSSYGGRYYY